MPDDLAVRSVGFGIAAVPRPLRTLMETRPGQPVIAAGS